MSAKAVFLSANPETFILLHWQMKGVSWQIGLFYLLSI
jgi:hypothetical protein